MNAPTLPQNLKQRALYEEVAELLRQRIFSRELPPGDWIDELKLAEEYGISRTPLREALKVLATEGLVTMKVRRGAYVTEVNEKDLTDVYHLLDIVHLIGHTDDRGIDIKTLVSDAHPFRCGFSKAFYTPTFQHGRCIRQADHHFHGFANTVGTDHEDGVPVVVLRQLRHDVLVDTLDLGRQLLVGAHAPVVVSEHDAHTILVLLEPTPEPHTRILRLSLEAIEQTHGISFL